MESMAQLRRRWRQPEFASQQLPAIRQFLATGSAGQHLDLRGAEVGLEHPLDDFQLDAQEFADLDLSFGKGVLIVRKAKVARLTARRFQFDQASYFQRSIISEAGLQESKGRYDAIDTEFRDCTFDHSTFKGGFNEYGFRRCKFFNCSFRGIRWRNTYIRASEFHDCDFTDSEIATSVIVGMKFFGVADWESIFSECEIASIYVDSVQVYPRR